MCRLKMPINRPIEGLFIWGLTIWQISARSIDRDVFKLVFTKVINFALQNFSAHVKTHDV